MRNQEDHKNSRELETHSIDGEFKIIYEGEKIKELKQSLETYITRICKKIKKFMRWNLKGYNNPLDMNYHAETDESNFLFGEE